MAISKSAVKKLRAIYLDEMVTIFLTNMNVVTVSEDHQEIRVSAMRQGYVIDVDEHYWYLGTLDGAVTATVAHELGQMVEIEFIVGDMMDTDIATDEDIH